ncbi:hypothetical protein GCM10017557_35080 [Streptomyces aurantiacus]|uniref:Replication initiation protein n=1 Tax=Streptomyces aurantiacus TaxID=47760 RepID=A0A7G1P080_9ACTN|nr:hypothetical protein GCM10017557_35080 [Streptomyces aurantiacus]
MASWADSGEEFSGDSVAAVAVVDHHPVCECVDHAQSSAVFGVLVLVLLSQREFREHARVSFAKVAEYQKRGAVHFHAVIRIDGPEGGDTPPPAWATAELLTDAIRAAATAARVDGPVIDSRAHVFAFGRQLDVRTIRGADFDGGQELTDRAVAAYIAKYATKGAEAATGTLDRPLKFLAELAQLDISEHARRLVRTA